MKDWKDSLRLIFIAGWTVPSPSTGLVIPEEKSPEKNSDPPKRAMASC